MVISEKKYVESLLKNYQEKEITKLDQLKKLDKKVKKPAKIFAYVFGSIGALILGMGMSVTMVNQLEMKSFYSLLSKLIPIQSAMIIGIIIGLIGLVMTISNYFIYKVILKSRKNKYSDEIISLSQELLNK